MLVPNSTAKQPLEFELRLYEAHALRQSRSVYTVTAMMVMFPKKSLKHSILNVKTWAPSVTTWVWPSRPGQSGAKLVMAGGT